MLAITLLCFANLAAPTPAGRVAHCYVDPTPAEIRAALATVDPKRPDISEAIVSEDHTTLTIERKK